MRILTRYFVARFLTFFAGILLAATLVIILVETLLNFDDMWSAHGGVGGAAVYLFLRVPAYYLRDLVPGTVFAATFFSLGLSTHWLETTAIKAGGISPHRIAFPLLVTASLLAGVTFVVNETLVIQATREWKRFERGGGAPIEYRQGSFWYHRGRTIYNAAQGDRETQTLRGVQIYRLSPQGRLQQSIEAERVHIDDSRQWHLENAIIRRFDASSASSAPEIEVLSKTVISIGDDSDQPLMDADASHLSLGALMSAADDGPFSRRLQSMLHTRLADPFAVLLLALLAIPLALQVEASRGLSRPAIIGVAVVSSFYLLRSVGSAIAAEGALAPEIAPWATLALFGTWGAWRLARMPR